MAGCWVNFKRSMQRQFTPVRYARNSRGNAIVYDDVLQNEEEADTTITILTNNIEENHKKILRLEQEIHELNEKERKSRRLLMHVCNFMEARFDMSINASNFLK